MFRAFIVSLCLSLGVCPAIADGVSAPIAISPIGQSRTAVKFPPVASGASYTGPGDVKSGWTAFWGFRAFSAATRGNKVAYLCNSTGGVDVLCLDASTDPTTGSLVIPGSLTSFCPGANCTVQRFYDTSGSSNCGGPCDMDDTTISTRPILTANAIGTRTCANVPSTGDRIGNGSFAGLSQPLSVSAVAQFSSASGSQIYVGASGGGGNGAGLLTTTGSFFGFYGSNNVLGATADTAAHAFQSVFNSASSFTVTDTSTSSTQSSGGASWGALLVVLGDAFGDGFEGNFCEAGVYPAAFSGTDVTNMHANQSAYYGTP